MNKIKINLLSGAIIAASLIQPTALAAKQSTQIVQIKGDNSYQTAARANTYANDSYDHVYIASGINYPDALTGGVLAGENNGALIFTTGADLDQESRDIANKAKKVTILGGDRVVSEKLAQEFGAERIFGENRYETAVKSAEALGTDRNIAIVSGQNFADTLSSTGLSILEDRNILLVDKDEMPKATKEYLENYGKDKDIIFIGGERAISKKTKEEAFTLAGKDPSGVDGATVYGKDRYETSAKVAKRFDSPSSIVLTNGDGHIDALSASAISAKEKAPVVLARRGYKDLLRENIDTKALSNIVIIGGDKAVDPTEAIQLVSENDGIDLDQVQLIDHQGQTIASLSLLPEELVKKEPQLNEEAETEKPAETEAQTEAQKEKPKGTFFEGYIVNEDLKVRRAPDWSADSLGVLNEGTKVKGTMNDGWLLIDYEGKDGYLSQDFLSAKKPEEKIEEKKNTPTKRQDFIDAALTMKGWQYSQSRRMQNGYADCSSLVLRSMRKAGLDSTGANLTTRSIGSDRRFEQISKSQLQKGDILWKSGHMAIYMGGNDTFEARNYGKKVGYYKMNNRFTRYYRIKGL